MTKMNDLKKIIAEKQKKKLSKFNTLRERFEERKKIKTAELKETRDIFEKLNDELKWRQTIP